MSEQDQQYPDTWPGVQGREQKPGMTITGKVVSAREFKNRQDQRRVGIDVQKDDGTIVSVPGWHYALTQLLDEAGQRGELTHGATVTIEYEGEKPLGNGRNPLKLYKVNGRSSQGAGGSAPSWFSGGEPPVPEQSQQAVPAGVAAGAADDDDDLPF